MPARSPQTWSRFALCGLLALLLGCGKGQPCSVSGTVKYGGELIATGSLRFDPVDASETQPIGGKISEGKYDIPLNAGLLAGKYHIAIYATRETGKTLRPPEALGGKILEPYKEVVQYIPTVYNASTKLNVELKPGANTAKDFDLPKAAEPASTSLP